MRSGAARAAPAFALPLPRSSLTILQEKTMFTQKLTAALAFCAMALVHGAAWSQQQPSAEPAAPVAAPAPSAEGKELAEKFIRPIPKGIVALVFDEKGEVIAVTREGRTLPTCQVCTPELARKYGPRCAKARKLSDLKSAADDRKAAAAPLICDKLVNTTIEDVSPISAIKHTGSQCISFFFNSNGQAKVYQYCW
jgi:hypothetical protein